MPFHSVKTHNTRSEFLSTLLGYSAFKPDLNKAADELFSEESDPLPEVHSTVNLETPEDVASSDDELVDEALTDFSSALETPAYNDLTPPNNTFPLSNRDNPGSSFGTRRSSRARIPTKSLDPSNIPDSHKRKRAQVSIQKRGRLAVFESLRKCKSWMLDYNQQKRSP